MATILYKDGEEGFFHARRVKSMIEAGWTVENKPVEPEVPTEKEADINESGKLNATEVRAAAKAAGFEDWKTARIKPLKKRLGYES